MTYECVEWKVTKVYTDCLGGIFVPLVALK